MGRNHLLKVSRAIATGFAAGLVFIFLLSVLSGLLMSRRRAMDAARDALQSDAVAHPFSHLEEDYFTECAMLVMNMARAESVARNAIESWLPSEALAFGHPCETLRRYVAAEIRLSSPPSGRINPRWRWDIPYVSYWFGSRHVEAIVLRLLDFEQAQRLYRLLSYGAVLILALAAWHSDSRIAIVLIPLFVSLLFGFSLHLNGHLLAHAPGYFIAFLALALLVVRRRSFEPFERRLAFFACLAVLVSFFDLLNGCLLLVLSLCLVMNHFFYSRREHWRVALGHGVAIVGCFAICYVAVTIVHLTLLDLLHNRVWQTYFDGLSVRLAGVADTGQKVRPGDVALALWSKRASLVPGGVGPSTTFLAGGLAAWIFAAVGLPAFRRHRDTWLLADLAALAIAGGGIFAWCLLFRNHTFEHSWFTVRYLTLPTGYGAVAAVVVVLGLRNARRGARAPLARVRRR